MPERNSGMVLFINLIEDKVKMKKILQKKRIGSTHLTNVDNMVSLSYCKNYRVSHSKEGKVILLW